MPQPLTLSRAAKLAGVTRSELQKKLRDSGLNIFEGKIAIGDLLSVYPEIDLNRDPVFERIQRIKQIARPKREYSDGWVPDADVLMARLKEMHAVLVRTKAALNRNEALIAELEQRLGKFGDTPDTAVRSRLSDLREWLAGRLESPLNEADARAELFARDTFLKVLAPKVKLTPSGHEYFVEGRESLLDAALRGGLHLDYGCSSGNCGACKCRIVSGNATRLRPHDYVLSTREQEAGYVLACSWTAVTDLVIEAHEAATPSDLPVQDIRAAVQRIEHLGAGGAALYLQTPRTNTLRFMSGQSVRLTNEDGASGTYPLASCACDGRHLWLLMRDKDGDSFSRSVLADAVTGQVVRVEGPFGEFVLREDSPAPCVFVAAGDGIGPIKSLVEQAVSIDNADSLHVYLVDEPAWGNKVRNVCRSWQDALDNFRLSKLPQHTDAADLRSQLHADHADLAECDVYLAGPAQLVRPLGEMLKVDTERTDDSIRVLALG